MNSKPNFTHDSWSGFNWLLTALALCLTVPARGETPPAAIPFADIGARATAGYQGDALEVRATADGARLRCGFQKLEGHATPEGLWLESTRPGSAGRLRVTATALSRGALSTLNPPQCCPPSAVLRWTGYGGRVNAPPSAVLSTLRSALEDGLRRTGQLSISQRGICAWSWR
jgi:hypothetical protein